MAEEYHRKRARKKIKLPSGETIYIPVLNEIGFADPVDRGQETFFTVRNDETSSRELHVDSLLPTPNVDADGNPPDGAQLDTSGDPLMVERVDKWIVIDPVNRAQETQAEIDNRTGSDTAPPRFVTHAKTHIYRYFKDPQNPDDSGVWIDSELIDEIALIDPVRRAQETHYILDNPTNEEFREGDLSGQASDDDEDITMADGGEGTEAFPVRTDPFQNIVNWSDAIWIIIGFSVVSVDHSANASATGGPPPALLLQATQYMTDCSGGLSFNTSSAAVIRSNGTTYNAIGATWSYSGGSSQVLDTPAPNTKFSSQTTPGAFVFVTEDAPSGNTGDPGMYQDFKLNGVPAYFDTLTVTAEAWGLDGDGINYKTGSGPSAVGFMASTGLTAIDWNTNWPPGAETHQENIFHYGNVFASRTFDFTGIVVTYNGEEYDSVAVLFATRGQSITVLCRRHLTA